MAAKLEISYNGVDYTEISPRPFLVEGWGEGQDNEEVKTIDGNLINYIDKYHLRKMAMRYESLTVEYRDTVLDFFKEYTDAYLRITDISELGYTGTPGVVPISILKVGYVTNRVPLREIYDVTIEFRDRLL